MKPDGFKTKRGINIEFKLYTLAEIEEIGELKGEYALQLDGFLVNGKPAFADAKTLKESLYSLEAKEMTEKLLEANGVVDSTKN